MKIYLLRHGEAYQLGEKNASVDSERSLTSRGERQSSRAGKMCAFTGDVPEVILTSPYLRARQTAEQFRRGLNTKVEIRETASLEPPGDTGALVREISDLENASVLLVGHEPFLGELLQFFLNGDTEASVPLSKGSLSCLELDTAGENGAKLRWSLNAPFIKTMLKLVEK